MELLALLLCLILNVLEASLKTPPFPFLSNHLRSELLDLLLGGAQGLAGLGEKVGLDPGLILGIFHPLLGHEYLLDGLRRNDKGIRYQIRKRVT